jgi:hypothetical protein
MEGTGHRMPCRLQDVPPYFRFGTDSSPCAEAADVPGRGLVGAGALRNQEATELGDLQTARWMVCLQRTAGAYSREAGGESGGAAASMTCLGEETPPSRGPLLTNGAKNLFTNRIADSRPLSRHRQHQYSHRRYSAR